MTTKTTRQQKNTKRYSRKTPNKTLTRKIRTLRRKRKRKRMGLFYQIGYQKKNGADTWKCGAGLNVPILQMLKNC
jgi:hypothetical protein